MAATVALGLFACSPAAISIPPSSAASGPSPSQAPPATSGQPVSAVAVDPSLLAVLPGTVAGIELIESPEAERTALAGPELVAVGSAMAAGIAFDAPTGEFVYAVVIRLKPGAMNDGVFRDWRDSYDEGACSQADGVAGSAETQLGGRTVFTGTCTGGLRTYHVWLEAQGILVSASAVGERRLGEQLMHDLRP